MSDPGSAEASAWPVLFDGLSAISAMVIASVAVFGAWTARQALSTWQTEALWKEDRDLARRIMLQVIEVKDGFAHVRNPFHGDAEYPEDATDEAAHFQGVATTN